MTDLNKIVSERDYKKFAGVSWPSFSEFLAGARPQEVRQEIDAFVSAMEETYRNLVLQDPSVLADANRDRQRQVFYDKQYSGTSTCRIPWETLGINANGNVFICLSPSWVPKFVGNVLDSGSVYDALNSEIAQSIRWEILNRRYLYCNANLSSFLTRDRTHVNPTGDTAPLELPADRTSLLVSSIPKNIILDFDYTCNFKCPSCRTEVINNNKHHLIRPINDRIADKVKKIIDEVTSPTTIRWAGGEPFISEVYVSLMEYAIASGQPIKHVMQTNGSYLIKRRDLLTQILPHIEELRISFDAATADTYHKIRANGNWDTLIENTKFVIGLIKELALTTRVSVDFVVQKDNYQEIPQLKALCSDLGVDHIYYQRMWNWDTWPEEEFLNRDVHSMQHPDYPKLIKIFKSIGYEQT